MNIKLEIPESFFQGEERCGYYVSPEMKKVWAVELDLLNEFARVCGKHNLKWWADAGTLLGAVRHKGFIPWDDDVDIVMMRKDYEKLREIAAEEFKYPYFLEDDSNDPERLSPTPRLVNESTTLLEGAAMISVCSGKKVEYNQGIFIDIFILYDANDDDEAFRAFCRKARYLQKKFHAMSRFCYYAPAFKTWKRVIKGFIFGVIKALHIPLPYKLCKESFRRYFDTINSSIYPNSKRVALFSELHQSNFHERFVWDRSLYDNAEYFAFEMLTIPAPSHWRVLLDRCYGDWHKYEIDHVHTAFCDTERPYTYYTLELHKPVLEK